MGKKQSSKEKIRLDALSKVGIFSLSLFVTAIAVYLYSPVIKSHAEEGASPTVTANIGSVIALTLNSNELNLSTNPNNFVHDSLNVSVSTNSQFGYTLALEDADDSSNMTHTNSSISDVVTSTFTGSKTSGDMDNNTWGFSLDNTNYYSIPVLGSPVALKRTNTTMDTAYETTAVDFGVKVGMLTAGSYRDTVRFTAYVNGIDGNPDDGTTPSDPGGGETMQSFNCADMEIGDTAVLRDSRDGNAYSIAKLADGRCWMTQNLRISETTLISATSNLPDGETFEIPESDISAFTSDKNHAAVWIDNNLNYSGYYNFYTAVAGHNPSSGSAQDVQYDICPKGWRLPYGWSTIANVTEFTDLYLKYNENKNGEMVSGAPLYLATDGGVITNGSRPSGGWRDWSYFWNAKSNSQSNAGVNMVRAKGTQTAGGATTSNLNKEYGANIRCINK